MNDKYNNLFAGFLLAGIIAMSAGFAAKGLYNPQELKEDAYPVEVADAAAGGAGAAAAAPAVAEPIDALLATADLAHGEKLSKMCTACHSFDVGGANKVGPNLAGIVGAKHAHIPSFKYSDALQAKASEVWTVEALNQFLWNPRKAIPGTKMAFAGLKKPEDRAAMIKWLQTK
jgi:cytochrome c